MKMSAQEFAQTFPDHPLAQAFREQTSSQANNHRAQKKTSSTPKPSTRAIKGAPKAPSYLESLFEQQLKGQSLPCVQREYRFDPQRQWRMDFAWPDLMIAVEIEGGVWKMGRHNRPRGFIADAEKYNRATELGWSVLRFTGKTIKSGQAISQVAQIISNAYSATTGAQKPARPRAR